MDSLKDILASKDVDQPTEVTALKRFCQEQFNFEAKIKISPQYITVIVPNGILATELRMRQQEIIRRCQLTKKLMFRIG